MVIRGRVARWLCAPSASDWILVAYFATVVGVIGIGHFVCTLVPGFGPCAHLSSIFDHPLREQGAERGGTFYALVLAAAWRHYRRLAPAATFWTLNIIGQALGRGFVSRGHDVKMGSRDAGNAKAQAWAKQAGERASVGTFADAAKFGDAIALCTLWSATQQIIELAGPKNFEGKVVLDVTNPLAFPPGKPPELAIGHTDSAGEQVQRWLPGAKVVKVFNIVGNAHMVDPQFPGGPPDMFIAGNDADAKKIVSDICKSFGWPTVDIGGIEGARLLEPLCILWVHYGLRHGSWNHAFKLLRK